MAIRVLNRPRFELTFLQVICNFRQPTAQPTDHNRSGAADRLAFPNGVNPALTIYRGLRANGQFCLISDLRVLSAFERQGQSRLYVQARQQRCFGREPLYFD